MNDQTLKSLLPVFLKDLEDKHRSPSTILAYRSDLEQMVSFFQGKSKATIAQITQTDIEAYRDVLMGQKYTPKTVSRKLNAIKTFYRYLKAIKVILTDPSKNVSHPQIEVSVPKFLSPLEYRALRDAARGDKRVAAIIELILQAGLRISEVASLKIKDVKNQTVTIESALSSPKREIPLNEPAINAVMDYLVERAIGNTDVLFVSKNGNPLAVRNIRAVVDKQMQKAGVNGYSVNDLRTTFIVENLRAGVDLVLLSKYIGHKRLSTTERYLEIASTKEPGKLQELIEL